MGVSRSLPTLISPPSSTPGWGGGGGGGPPLFLTASHKGPFIPNQVRGDGGIWTGGGGGHEKTFHLATSGSVFLVFSVTYCIEWQ